MSKKKNIYRTVEEKKILKRNKINLTFAFTEIIIMLLCLLFLFLMDVGELILIIFAVVFLIGYICSGFFLIRNAKEELFTLNCFRLLSGSISLILIVGLSSIILQDVAGNFIHEVTQKAPETLITNNKYDEFDSMSFVTLSDTKFNSDSLSEIQNKSCGYVDKIDSNNMDEVRKKLNEESELSISFIKYQSLGALIDALYNNEIQIIVINEEFREKIEDLKPNFEDDTKVVYQVNTVENIQDELKNTAIAEEPLNVLFVVTADEDVLTVNNDIINVTVASINPVTDKILLTNLPINTYVYFNDYKGFSSLNTSNANGTAALSNSVKFATKFPIDGYIKTSKNNFKNFINEMEGVDISLEESIDIPSGHLNKGSNAINGDQALEIFMNELPNYKLNQKNSMAVYQGIFEKLITKKTSLYSSGILENFIRKTERQISDEYISVYSKKILLSDINIEYSLEVLEGEYDNKRVYVKNKKKKEKENVFIADSDSIQTIKDLINKNEKTQ